MAIDISSLSGATTAVQTLSNAVLVTPQSNVGIQAQPFTGKKQDPSFLFDIEEDNRLSFASDITDHYVEDNSTLQDQISQRPEEYTVRGLVSELNDVVPLGLQNIANLVKQKLVAISAYAPELTTTGLEAYNEAMTAYQTAKSVYSSVQSWSNIGSSSSTNINGVPSVDAITDGSVQNNQQKALQKFYGYWLDRTLFTVQTPWCVFKNMAIKNLSVTQNAETNVISEFEITFKMIRIAKTTTVGGQQAAALNKITSGQISAQSSPVLENGSAPVANSSVTQSTGLSQMGIA